MRACYAAILLALASVSPAHASFIGGVETYLYNNGAYTLIYPHNTFIGAGNNDAGEIVGGTNLIHSQGFVRGGTNGINNLGQTTGSFLVTTGIHRKQEVAFGPNGAFGPLDTRALDINDAGVIVGLQPASGGNFGGEFFPTNGFVYAGGVFSILSYPGAVATWLTGINDAGLILGNFFTGPLAGNCCAHAFLFDGSNFTVLDASGAGSTGSTFATGLNDEGDVVGYFRPTSTFGAPRIGFLYHDGVFTVLPPPHTTGRVFPEDINNEGEIVVIVGTPEPSSLAVFGVGVLFVLVAGVSRSFRWPGRGRRLDENSLPCPSAL